MEGPARILVIDDDEQVRRLIVRALISAGYQVAEARDGDAGLRAYRAEPADLVITDLVMPASDGIEVIQNLKAEFPAVRVIAISGGLPSLPDVDALQGPLRDAQLFGADAVLSKPLGMNEVVDVVRRLLEEPVS